MANLSRHGLGVGMRALLCVLAAGCVNPMVVDVEQRNVMLVDAGEDVEDADAFEDAERDAQASEPEPDAAAVTDAATSVDAALPKDAGQDAEAGLDAGRDAGLPHDAGSSPTDAGSCKEAGCDAGSPSGGPCAACGDVTVSIGPDQLPKCGNGAPQTCWSDPDGECSIQCPPSKSCTADDPNACGAGEYCFFPKNDCGAGSAGFCATTSKGECPTFSIPVCGCDGVRYKNGCLANKAGTGFADSLHATCK